MGDIPNSGDKKPARRKKPTAAKLVAALKKDAHIVGSFSVGKTRHVLIECPAHLTTYLFKEQPASESALVLGVERDLNELRKRAPALADSALAATALTLARELINPYNSATSKAYCSRELRETIKELWDLAPVERSKDTVDDLAQRRQERRAAAAGQ